MRFAFPTWRANAMRAVCTVAVAVPMVACTSSTSTDFSNQLSITGGDAQTVAVSAAAPLPLGVLVVDSFGNPVANAVVGWSVDSGSGTLKALSTTTGLDGKSTNTFTGGTTSGATVVTANVAGIYVVHFNLHVGS